VSLLEKPVYHALSYTWQDESLREAFDDPDKEGHQIPIQSYVLLDGLKLTVTKNLWVALWHFRRAARWHLDHPHNKASEFGDLELLNSGFGWMPEVDNRSNLVTAELLWWVDAICISQKDVPERDSQVSQMGTIYQDADCVHVWLGPIARTAHLLNELMTILGKRIPELRGQPVEEFIEGPAKVLANPSLAEYHSAMFSACEATYWSRLWIVQEYLLARTTMVHFGLRVADPRPIAYIAILVVVCYSSELVRDRTSGPGWDNVRRSIVVNDLRDKYRNHNKDRENVFHLLALFYDLHCSDPRDMVYGLLALSRSGEHEIPIDYSLAVEEVYQATAKFIIERLGQVDVIYALASPRFYGRLEQEPQINLPSWVPDWRFRGRFRLLNQSPNVQATDGTDFKASGSIKSQSRISENNKVLTCKGMALGTIDKVAFLRTYGDMATNTKAGWAHRYFSNIVDFIRATFHDSEVTPQLDHGIEVIYQLLFFLPKLIAPVITSKVFHEHCLSFQSTSPNIRTDVVKHLESTVGLDILSDFIDRVTLFSVTNIFPKTSTPEEESRVPTIGLCYPYCEPGDVLAILYRCTVPVALRPSKKNPGQFEVLCDVHVDGYMYGEAIGKFEEREFEIC
jgi:hypothetical protein